MSKGLKALEKIKFCGFYRIHDSSGKTDFIKISECSNDFEIVEKELIDGEMWHTKYTMLEEEHIDLMLQNGAIKKVLEVIKNKQVNVGNFVKVCSKMSYEQYKFMWEEGCFLGVKMTSKEILTEEEYNSLKEVLLCK